MGLPEATISAAFTFNMKELDIIKWGNKREEKILLFWKEINIALVFMRLFGGLKKFRRVLRIPRLPRLLAHPDIVSER